MKNVRRYSLTALFCVVVSLLIVAPLFYRATTEGQTRFAPRLGSTEINGRAFAPVQVVRAMPVIESPPVVSADQASETLQPNELVMGVEIDGQARAYPINMLTGPSREIFNDRLGGRDIAATW